jgi:hypothetical protein
VIGLQVRQCPPEQPSAVHSEQPGEYGLVFPLGDLPALNGRQGMTAVGSVAQGTPDGVRREALPKTERRQRPVEVGRDNAAEVQDQSVITHGM